MNVIDFKSYAKKYNYLSEEEVQESVKLYGNLEELEYRLHGFNFVKKEESNHGKKARHSCPLVHVQSIRIVPEKEKKCLVTAVYGSISVEYFDAAHRCILEHYLYYHDNLDSVKVLGSDGALTLNWDHFTRHREFGIIPMFISKIKVDLFDQDDDPLLELTFPLDDAEIQGEYEHVNSKRVRCNQTSVFLVVDYIAIPFGHLAYLSVRICSRKHESVASVKVNGIIRASWDNTYGNYSSQEFVLFDKGPNDFERVEIDTAYMSLSRCLVALPAYSSLVINVNLNCDSGEDINIVGGDIVGSFQLRPDTALGGRGHIFFNDNMYIQVSATWFEPSPLGRKVPTQGLPIEEPGPPLSNPAIRWPSTAIEIFSIFVGRKESNAVTLHGSIEVCSYGKSVYVFNRDKNNPLYLPQHMMTAPVLDSSRFYEDGSDLEIKFDMKDIGGNVDVKGYGKWDGYTLELSCYRDKQLCCFIRGEKGFVALHYSIFSHAVGACPKIFLKTPSSDVYPKVYGSITCEYRDYFYSSKFNRDYYRIVLFTQTQGDAVELRGDGDGDGLFLQRCRPLVVVPIHSALIINLELELECGFRKFEKVQETVVIEIGDKYPRVKKSDSIINIKVDWCLIK